MPTKPATAIDAIEKKCRDFSEKYSLAQTDEQWLASIEKQALTRPLVREILQHPEDRESIKQLSEAPSNTRFALRLAIACQRCRARLVPIEHIESMVSAHEGALKAAKVRRDKSAEELDRMEKEAPSGSTQREKSERRVMRTSPDDANRDMADSDETEKKTDAHLRRMNRARKRRAARKPAISGR